MKSISLDSPDPGLEETTGLGQRNMSMPKVVEHATFNNNNFGIAGVGNHRYGSWANVIRSRMAAANKSHVPSSNMPRRRPVPSTMDIQPPNSALASYNQCNLSTINLFCKLY
jgi:hypothetical protein